MALLLPLLFSVGVFFITPKEDTQDRRLRKIKRSLEIYWKQNMSNMAMLPRPSRSSLKMHLILRRRFPKSSQQRHSLKLRPLK